MTNIKSKLILSVAVLILAGASAASAQIGFGAAIHVDIPNSFVVKDKTFPAGKYTISKTPSLADSSSQLLLRGEHGNSMIFDTIAKISPVEAKSTQLVFSNIDGTEFLSEIRVAGDTAGFEIPRSKYERKFIATEKATQDSAGSTTGNNF